jgi:hypothetical protein
VGMVVIMVVVMIVVVVMATLVRMRRLRRIRGLSLRRRHYLFVDSAVLLNPLFLNGVILALINN